MKHRRWQVAALASMALWGAEAGASCMSLERYRVEGLNLEGPFGEVVRRLAGLARWEVEVSPPLEEPVALRNASGSLATLLRPLMEAAKERGYAVAVDADGCMIAMMVPPPLPPPAPPEPAPVEAQAEAAAIGEVQGAAASSGEAVATGAVPEEPPAVVETILPASRYLSDALREILRSQNWALRWEIDYDYLIAHDIPVEAAPGDVPALVEEVYRIYRRQGGFADARLRIAPRNRVVVFER